MINLLRGYFEGRTDVAFAFLYGSQARGKATRLSDVDVAVYFHPSARYPIEVEAQAYYGQEKAIWGDLTGLLKKEVELLVLNRVPAPVAASALRGIPLAIRDRGLYLDFMLTVTDAAEDFTQFRIRDYQEREALATGK